MIVGFRDEWLRAFFVDDVRSKSFHWDGSRGEASGIYRDDHSTR